MFIAGSIVVHIYIYISIYICKHIVESIPPLRKLTVKIVYELSLRISYAGSANGSDRIARMIEIFFFFFEPFRSFFRLPPGPSG